MSGYSRDIHHYHGLLGYAGALPARRALWWGGHGSWLGWWRITDCCLDCFPLATEFVIGCLTTAPAIGPTDQLHSAY